MPAACSSPTFADFCGDFTGTEDACVHGDSACPTRPVWSTIATPNP